MKYVPATYLKIDMLFVSGFASDRNDRNIWVSAGHFAGVLTFL